MNGESKSHFITLKKPFQKSFPYDSFPCHKACINSPYRRNPLKHKKRGRSRHPLLLSCIKDKPKIVDAKRQIDIKACAGFAFYHSIGPSKPFFNYICSWIKTKL